MLQKTRKLKYLKINKLYINMSLSIDGINLNKNTTIIKPNSADQASTEDIFTTYKNTKTSNDTEVDPKKQEKYWTAAMKTAEYNKEILNAISKYTGCKEYKNFPIEAKNIADKMNNFCNSMSSTQLVSARDSSDIDGEIKKCLQETLNKRNECLEELKEIYEPKEEKKDNKKNILNIFSINK